MSPPLHAGDARPGDVAVTASINHADRVSPHAEIRKLIEKETATTSLPPDVAEAVVFVESGYDSSVIGGVGEMGLMQVRPQTAAMLGFRGSDAELARPEINIHYGVVYLSRAWRLAGGDLCRALMKYRAGHGEEVMTPLSQVYCARARKKLLAMNSPWAETSGAVAALAPVAAPSVPAKPSSRRPSAAQLVANPLASPAAVYARYRQGTAAASSAFWAAHEARVSQIKARIEARWHRVASR